MEPQMIQRVYDEALAIGDDLLSKALPAGQGLFWETLGLTADLKPKWEVGESIYTGNTGIALFLLELYQVTGEERFLDAAKAGMVWTLDYCDKHPTDYYALYTGRMGVSYGLLRFHTLTGDPHYLDNALTIARDCKKFTERRVGVDDLINGFSGTLIGLLHLHAASAESWIIDAIDHYADILIDRAWPGPAGLYWDRSGENVHGLCGLSHGASGIGLAFLELGRYLDNPAFLELAKQAFAYENHHYDHRINNWPDWRRGIYGAEDRRKHTDAFLNGNIDFFTQHGDMNAWCHGAAGIGLSRLRAYEVLRDPAYLDDIDKAVAKIRETDLNPNDYLDEPPINILCHGLGGNADTLIQAYVQLGDPSFKQLANDLTGIVLASKSRYKKFRSGFADLKNEEDTSLFMGNAGIGYYLLRMMYPNKVPSILAPRLRKAKQTLPSTEAYKALHLTPSGTYRRLLEQAYPRTLDFMDQHHPELLASFMDSPVGELREAGAFNRFMTGAIHSLEAASGEILEDVFLLEKQKGDFDRQISSHSLLNIARMLSAEEAKDILEEGLRDSRKLCLDPYSKIITTKWNWDPDAGDYLENPTHEPDEYPVILSQYAEGIREISLNPLSAIIAETFTVEKLTSTGVDGILESVESSDPEELEAVRQQVLAQLRELITAGLIVGSCHTHAQPFI